MRFKNKVVLITGASRGIGRATALAFAQEWAKIIVNYNFSEKDAHDLVRQIEQLGSQAIAIQCDIASGESVESMIQQGLDYFGRIDILVNNAGVVVDKPIFEKTIEEFKRTIDVNLTGNFLCTRWVAVHMLAQWRGKIINVSSTNAINTFSPDALDYDASKAGIITLTKDFAKALAPSIQVNAIAPGWVNTEMNKDLPEDFIQSEVDKIYLKRFAEPIEIARTILFLASDDASHITGSILVVDGWHD